MAKSTSALLILYLFVMAMILNGTTEAAGGRGGGEGDPVKSDLMYGSEQWFWGLWPFDWFHWWLTHFGFPPTGPVGPGGGGPGGGGSGGGGSGGGGSGGGGPGGGGPGGGGPGGRGTGGGGPGGGGLGVVQGDGPNKGGYDGTDYGPP